MTFLVTIRLDISLFERWRRTWSSSSGSRKRRSCGEDITVGVSEGEKKTFGRKALAKKEWRCEWNERTD